MLDGIADMRAAEQSLVEEAVEVEPGRVCGAEIRLHEYICVEDKGVGVPVRLDARTTGFDNVEIRVESQAVNYIREAAIFILDQHALVVRGEAVDYIHLPYSDRDGHTL